MIDEQLHLVRRARFVAGCVAQAEGAEIMARQPLVDLVAYLKEVQE